MTAVLEHHFATRIEIQKDLGTLFKLDKGGIKQYADYFWQSKNITWIGDAKYKHLTKDSEHPLRFATPENEVNAPRAGQVLSAADVRQLTVYAELQKGSGALPHLALLYPYAGSAALKTDTAIAWNGAEFHLIPVRVGGFSGAPNLEVTMVLP